MARSAHSSGRRFGLSGSARSHARRLVGHLRILGGPRRVDEAGGGIALVNAADKVRESITASLEGDEKTGAQIILKALEEPVRQLATNAGLEGSVVVQSVRSAKPGQGLNIDTGAVEDLVKAGIIDPTMVPRSALQNAASIGKNILTTEAIVADAPEKNPAGAGAGMPDMSGMM